ncbi:hypothetical protein [Erythrobacter sp. JK5]|uniref:hypothetical protein n=1 Tax=Erythrobacter sp. JK5 TaxID=2829500 RepID=UPI001BA93CB1|nr:hypothetical protein [Erythrobacter sp. JK5]QUL39092.1 hypothetical protein KDC96_07110 [Erythrobacter sp. JK5]
MPDSSAKTTDGLFAQAITVVNSLTVDIGPEAASDFEPAELELLSVSLVKLQLQTAELAEQALRVNFPVEFGIKHAVSPYALITHDKLLGPGLWKIGAAEDPDVDLSKHMLELGLGVMLAGTGTEKSKMIERFRAFKKLLLLIIAGMATSQNPKAKIAAKILASLLASLDDKIEQDEGGGGIGTESPGGETEDCYADVFLLSVESTSIGAGVANETADVADWDLEFKIGAEPNIKINSSQADASIARPYALKENLKLDGKCGQMNTLNWAFNATEIDTLGSNDLGTWQSGSTRMKCPNHRTVPIPVTVREDNSTTATNTTTVTANLLIVFKCGRD